MTIGELRAFIEGMSIETAPTPEQWARISEKLATVQAFVPAPQMPNVYRRSGMISAPNGGTLPPSVYGNVGMQS
jgi:hypothetical protein